MTKFSAISQTKVLSIVDYVQ